MRSFWAAVLLLTSIVAFGQSDNVGEHIYKTSQNSVFLVYLNDNSGNPEALGSAFLVGPNLLITNAHVAEAGTPVLAVGPVRIPLKILRIDQHNDLALLSVNLNLVSKPLVLAINNPSPGEQIFALGNPEGLEKTISQGIVSGLRTLDGRDLIQITSPISHGSSGGPILNANGQVIGVAVGILENGQNLNFAVPIKYARALLNEKSVIPMSEPQCAESAGELSVLLGKMDQGTYSDDPSSQYQIDTRQLVTLMNSLLNGCVDPKVLSQVACTGTKAPGLSDIGIKAAHKLVETKPIEQSRALLAYVLYDRAQDAAFTVAFSKDGTTEKSEAIRVQTDYLSQAKSEALAVRERGSGGPLWLADYVLASVDDDDKDYPQAISLNSFAVDVGVSACGVDLSRNAYEHLITENVQTGNPAAAEKWFRTYLSKYQVTAYDWDAEGDRRQSAGDLPLAAEAYERAANGSSVLGYDFCYAAQERYFQKGKDNDAVLADGRKCVDASVKDTGEYAQKQFTATAPRVYTFMADVLDQRGVYDEALNYIRESLSAKPDDPMSLYTEAQIFTDLEKYPECIQAAQAAIRSSDGKFAFMQFGLGTCYFSTQDWGNAANSFRLAAEGDKTDAGAAFNLGLSLSRQGYSADARQWFQEALRRNPDSELRAKILSALK